MSGYKNITEHAGYMRLDGRIHPSVQDIYALGWRIHDMSLDGRICHSYEILPSIYISLDRARRKAKNMPSIRVWTRENKILR